MTRIVGMPGSGVFYTSRIGLHSSYHSAALMPPATTRRQQRSADRHVELVVVVLIGLAALAGLVATAVSRPLGQLKRRGFSDGEDT